MSFPLPLLALLAGFLLSGPSRADSEWRGYVAGEMRAFAHDPSHAGQRQGSGPSLIAEPEFTHHLSPDALLRVTPFTRVDNIDGKRTHADIRELYWQQRYENYEMLVGINHVFWGVAESRHLINIVNQIDAVESPEEEAFLGQPMLNLSWLGGEAGTLRAYLLPGFRERTLPGRRGRLRFAIPFDTEDATYESEAGPGHVDVAARYAVTLDDVDVGISGFHGTSREPRFMLGINDGAFVLVPHYDIISQGGLDLQAVRGNWLFKYEGLLRQGQGRRFYAHAGGVEYTFYDLARSGMDLGLLAEHLFDLRDYRALAAPIDHGVFFGTRVAFNDTQDTSILFGIATDLGEGSTMLKLEASRRIDDHWKMEFDGRVFAYTDSDSPLDALSDDDHAMLRLKRYF